MSEALTFPDPNQSSYSKATVGFWIYLMTDAILFTTLFVTYAVLHVETFGGPGPKDLFEFKSVIFETAALLASNISFGFAMLASAHSQKGRQLFWMAIAFVFGLTFVALEFHEFYGIVAGGHSWQTSAFLSSFFTLVGTHGLHVSFGLIWMATLFIQILFKGITLPTFRRTACLSLFWHFLDLIWVFIFTFVYLAGLI